MKKYLIIGSLLSSFAWAHQPYVAPNSYITNNTQIPVLAGFAEDALHAEHALKENNFTITDPTQKTSTIQPTSTLKSATVFDLALPQDGTYQIRSQVSYPLEYALHEKQWKLFFDTTPEKAGALKDRDYVIPADFEQNKTPTLENITREWTIQSYVTKKKSTPISQTTESPLNVNFSVHPNEIKTNTPIKINVQKDKKPLKDAQISVLTQGQEEDKAIKAETNAQGLANLSFPKSGEYLITVHEKKDPSQKPEKELYTITTVYVQP